MEGNETTIEELLGIIKLQEGALEYYANKKNYSGNIETMPILKDRGEQARFILNQAKKIREYRNELEEKIKRVIQEFEEINLDGIDMDETKKNVNAINNIFKNLL